MLLEVTSVSRGVVFTTGMAFPTASLLGSWVYGSLASINEIAGNIWKPLFHPFSGVFIFRSDQVFSVLFSLKFTGNLPSLTESLSQRHFLSRYFEKPSIMLLICLLSAVTFPN